jgi:hypothetical protein
VRRGQSVTRNPSLRVICDFVHCSEGLVARGCRPTGRRRTTGSESGAPCACVCGAAFEPGPRFEAYWVPQSQPPTHRYAHARRWALTTRLITVFLTWAPRTMMSRSVEKRAPTTRRRCRAWRPHPHARSRCRVRLAHQSPPLRARPTAASAPPLRRAAAAASDKGHVSQPSAVSL